MKTLFKLLVLILLLQSNTFVNATTPPNEESLIHVEVSETYELANIILAITDYGINDPLEVQKGTAYYEEVIRHFLPYANHPLISKINYSKERWKEFLSFRTDAYAYTFDEYGNLERHSSFYTNKGLSPFDDNLALIIDFVEQSNFRSFYESKRDYYASMLEAYEATYLIYEMKQFLSNEYGRSASGKYYKIVLSPLVYRMNCYRQIDSSMEADFPQVARHILEGKSTDAADAKTRANHVHALFRKIFKRYSAEVSEIYYQQIQSKFTYKYWNDIEGSYEGFDSSYASFNEYMTWAVYDIFILEYFPEIADNISLDWHFQNKNRGFTYSYLFSKKLLDIYKTQKNARLMQLYPTILDWCNQVQAQLTQPKIENAQAPVVVRAERSPYIRIQFTEPLMQEEQVSFMLYRVSNRKVQKIRPITITKAEHDLSWSADGTSLSFILTFDDMDQFILDVNAAWGGINVLKNKDGVLLEPAKIRVITK